MEHFKDFWNIRHTLEYRAARAVTVLVYDVLQGQYDDEEGPTPQQVRDATDTVIEQMLLMRGRPW